MDLHDHRRFPRSRDRLRVRCDSDLGPPRTRSTSDLTCRRTDTSERREEKPPRFQPFDVQGALGTIFILGFERTRLHGDGTSFPSTIPIEIDPSTGRADSPNKRALQGSRGCKNPCGARVKLVLPAVGLAADLARLPSAAQSAPVRGRFAPGLRAAGGAAVLDQAGRGRPLAPRSSVGGRLSMSPSLPTAGGTGSPATGARGREGPGSAVRRAGEKEDRPDGRRTCGTLNDLHAMDAMVNEKF